jgi:ABC-type ATPase with predicted acetyltransferase domain
VVGKVSRRVQKCVHKYINAKVFPVEWFQEWGKEGINKGQKWRG